MNVNPNRDIKAAAQVSNPPKQDAKSLESDPSDFKASTKLVIKIAATPTVRADEVARAKTLIADPNYPDTRTIREVARQLADKIQVHSDSKSKSSPQ